MGRRRLQLSASSCSRAIGIGGVRFLAASLLATCIVSNRSYRPRDRPEDLFNIGNQSHSPNPLCRRLPKRLMEQRLKQMLRMTKRLFTDATQSLYLACDLNKRFLSY